MYILSFLLYDCALYLQTSNYLSAVKRSICFVKNITQLRIIMPLFSSKFSPKTIPVRRQDTSVIKNEFGSEFASKELSIDVGPLKMKLGDFEIVFEDGQWIPASGRAGATHKEVTRLKKELERLEEENNMLRLKFEILLDMMTDKTVEAEQQADRDMQRAQSLGSLKVKKKKEKW